jgi:dolichol-phosphate mannosyltransferase
MTESRPRLSIVVPVWGGRHDLGRLLPVARAALDVLKVDGEVIVAARGAADLADYAAASGVTMVDVRSSAYGHILRSGLEAARGSWIVTMDADAVNTADFIRTMWANRSDGEVLIGSRYVRGAVVQMGFGRRFLSRLLNIVYRKGLSVPFRDLSSGFRMYRRDVLDDIAPLEAGGLDILLEILVKSICQGWMVREIPIWYQGSGPWSRARMTRLGLSYLGTLRSLFGLRNSIKAADYDHRAFDSWIPLQRYWQRKRFEIIRNFVASPAGGRILDIGCGSSRIVQTLPGVVGMDLAMRKLRWLRAPGRHLLKGDMNRLPFRDGAFDTVICSEVIEHIPKEDVRLEELVRVISAGGLLVLGTPDYSRKRWLFLEWVYGKVFPNGYVKEHINRYSREGLREELFDLGLEILSYRYVGGSEVIFAARVPAVDREIAPTR